MSVRNSSHTDYRKRRARWMLRRIEALFDQREETNYDRLLNLIISDYLAYYGPPTPTRVKWSVTGTLSQESPKRLALLFVPRLLNNPCLHATLLLRLASCSPRFLLGFWRTILLAKHAIDISHSIEIGPGLLLPHPMGIGLGPTVQIGRNVTILNDVSLGGKIVLGGGRGLDTGSRWAPRIGDDAIIFQHSIIIGGITIGARAVVSAGAWVERDVGPRQVHPGRAALFRKFVAGQEISS